MHTTQSDTRYPEQCVVIAVNVSDEDIILNKGMALCFVQKTDLTIKTPHGKDMDTVHMVNKGDMVDTKREILENSPQEITLDSNEVNCHDNTEKPTSIPENSAFMFHRDFYLKPRLTLLDAELSPKTQQQLETLLEEFSDIMSKISSDIGLTHLEEMVLHMKPGSIPEASKPYSPPLRHHNFIKEEWTNLLEAGLIKQSLSTYAAPIMVVPWKVPAGSSLTETKRLVIDYWELNKQLSKVQMVQAKVKGTIALIKTAKIDHIWAKLKGA